jgi:hypothetical protein
VAFSDLREREREGGREGEREGGRERERERDKHSSEMHSFSMFLPVIPTWLDTLRQQRSYQAKAVLKTNFSLGRTIILAIVS